MTVTAFFSPARPSVVRRLHDGPLGLYVDDYAAQLVEQGFSRVTALRSLRLVADLSRWLERRKLGVDQLDEAALRQYQSFRARTWPLGFGDPMALHRLLVWTREKRICTISAPLAVPSSYQQVRGLRSLSFAGHRPVGANHRTLHRYPRTVLTSSDRCRWTELV